MSLDVKRPSESNVSGLGRFTTRIALGAVLATPLTGCGNVPQARTLCVCNYTNPVMAEERNLSREEAKENIKNYAIQHVDEWISEAHSAAEVQRKYSEELRSFVEDEGIELCVFNEKPDYITTQRFETPQGESKIILIKISNAGIATKVVDPRF